MKFKSTIIMFLVFVGLGGYVYFAEYRGRDERQKQEEAKKKAFQAEQKDISEITLKYPDRTITGVKKGDKQWQFTSPAGIEADPDEWEGLASNVPRIERGDAVAQGVQDLGQFGLTQPPLTVAAKLTDGRSVEIAFGAENPGKTYRYAKLAGSNDVFLSPSIWVSTFTKTVSELRNKKILQFESGDIDAVKVTDGAKELEFQKSGDHWQIKKPSDLSGDDNEISSFLSSIQFARAVAFPDPPVDSKKAGLDPPAIRILLHDKKANADRVLLIGQTAEPDKFYARDASRDSIFTIDKEIPEKIRRPIFDWRDKHITKIDRNTIEQIEIQRGAETSSFRKVDADWKLPDGRKLQWDKISAMLSTLEFDKAKEILDMPKGLATYGLDKPRVEVVFRKGADETGRVAFGGDSQNPEGIYFKASDSPAVKVVAKDIFDKFNVKADDLVETPSTAK
jgi:hypothetical protein